MVKENSTSNQKDSLSFCVRGISSLIRECIPHLSLAEKAVAECVLTGSLEVTKSSISRLARQAGVGEATVIRFCQDIGLEGFSELKLRLAQDYGSSRYHVNSVEADDHQIADLATTLCRAIADTSQLVSTEDLREAATLLRQAAKQAAKIEFYGTALLGYTAMIAKYRFLQSGVRADACDNPAMQPTFASNLKPGDVAVAMSRSGLSQSVLDTVAIAKEAGAKVIAITGYGNSPLARKADIVIRIKTSESGDYIRFQALICALVVIEGLLLQLTPMMREGTP